MEGLLRPKIVLIAVLLAGLSILAYQTSARAESESFTYTMDVISSFSYAKEARNYLTSIPDGAEMHQTMTNVRLSIREFEKARNVLEDYKKNEDELMRLFLSLICFLSYEIYKAIRFKTMKWWRSMPRRPR